MSLFLPSFICVLLLIAHSLVFRGWRVTLAFFGLCYVVKVLKCLGDSVPATRDYFPLTNFLPQLTYKGIPYGSYLFVIPIGWIFAHYIAWCIAEAILRNKPNKRNAFFPTVALSILGTGLIGICMEKVNEGIGWWRWEPHVQTNIAQYFSVWTLWSIMFYYFFFMLFLDIKRKAVNKIAAAYSFIFIGAFCLYIGVGFSRNIGVLIWFLAWTIVFCILFLGFRGKEINLRKKERTLATSLVVFCLSSWISSMVLKQVAILLWFIVWTIMVYYLFFLFFIKEPMQRVLNMSAIIYLLIFFVSIYGYVLFPKQLIMLIWFILILAQIPLYFVNSVKLRPMRKEDIAGSNVAIAIESK